jgi:hypothetical protein
MVLNLMIQKSCGEGNVVILIGFWVSGAVVEKLGNYFDITTPYPFPPFTFQFEVWFTRGSNSGTYSPGGSLSIGYLLLVWEI